MRILSEDIDGQDFRSAARTEDGRAVAFLRQLVVLAQRAVVVGRDFRERRVKLVLRAVVARVDAIVQIPHPEDVVELVDRVEAIRRAAERRRRRGGESSEAAVDLLVVGLALRNLRAGFSFLSRPVAATFDGK